MRLPRGAPVRMTNEGVGETCGLADALNFFIPRDVQAREKFEAGYFTADLSRLLQSLQNFGQVAPFSILPAAFASFHSAAHFFCRSRAAIWPALGSLFDFAFFADAAGCCADAV